MEWNSFGNLQRQPSTTVEGGKRRLSWHPHVIGLVATGALIQVGCAGRCKERINSGKVSAKSPRAAITRFKGEMVMFNSIYNLSLSSF